MKLSQKFSKDILSLIFEYDPTFKNVFKTKDFKDELLLKTYTYKRVKYYWKYNYNIITNTYFINDLNWNNLTPNPNAEQLLHNNDLINWNNLTPNPNAEQLLHN
jgi:hypothetical protein